MWCRIYGYVKLTPAIANKSCFCRDDTVSELWKRQSSDLYHGVFGVSRGLRVPSTDQVCMQSWMHGILNIMFHQEKQKCNNYFPCRTYWLLPFWLFSLPLISHTYLQTEILLANYKNSIILKRVIPGSSLVSTLWLVFIQNKKYYFFPYALQAGEICI